MYLGLGKLRKRIKHVELSPLIAREGFNSSTSEYIYYLILLSNCFNKLEMETTPELAAEGAALVRVLSTVLDRLVCANAALAAADPGQVTKFHALKAPGIGVHQYLERYVLLAYLRKIDCLPL